MHHSVGEIGSWVRVEANRQPPVIWMEDIELLLGFSALNLILESSVKSLTFDTIVSLNSVGVFWAPVGIQQDQCFTDHRVN